MGEWEYKTTHGGGETVQVRVEGGNRDELHRAAREVLGKYFGTIEYRIIQFDAEAEVDQRDGQVSRWQAEVTATSA